MTERRRAIYARAAVVCFALAAGLGFLWFGLAVGFPDVQAVIWALCIFVAGCLIFWPMTPLALSRTRTRVGSLPHREEASLPQQNTASEDGRKAFERGSGEVAK